MELVGRTSPGPAVVVVKVVGTAAVVMLLVVGAQAGGGVLGEVARLPPVVAAVAVVGFFAAVALYCRVLGQVLAAVPPQARATAVGGVWWMFAIPYNFTEDFFIVAAVARSLEHDGTLPRAVVRRWRHVGVAWCMLQVVSLVPGPWGVAGGAAALVAWVVHWRMTLGVLSRLGVRRRRR